MAALADTERAFARETAKVGIRAGFLAWFAHDAIGFRPALGDAWDQVNRGRRRPIRPRRCSSGSRASATSRRAASWAG